MKELTKLEAGTDERTVVSARELLHILGLGTQTKSLPSKTTPGTTVVVRSKPKIIPTRPSTALTSRKELNGDTSPQRPTRPATAGCLRKPSSIYTSPKCYDRGAPPSSVECLKLPQRPASAPMARLLRPETAVSRLNHCSARTGLDRPAFAEVSMKAQDSPYDNADEHLGPNPTLKTRLLGCRTSNSPRRHCEGRDDNVHRLSLGSVGATVRNERGPSVTSSKPLVIAIRRTEKTGEIGPDLKRSPKIKQRHLARQKTSGSLSPGRSKGVEERIRREKAALILVELHSRTISAQLQDRRAQLAIEQHKAAKETDSESDSSEQSSEASSSEQEDNAGRTFSAAAISTKSRKAIISENICSLKFNLWVTIFGAESLPPADPFRESDPFCICQIAGKPSCKAQTTVKLRNLSPIWDEKLVLEGFELGDSLDFRIYHKDLKENVLLATASLEGQRFLVEHWTEAELGLRVDAGLAMRTAHVRSRVRRSMIGMERSVLYVMVEVLGADGKPLPRLDPVLVGVKSIYQKCQTANSDEVEG